MDLEPYLDFALETAWAAGRITLGYFQRPLAEDRKPDNTPVTAADRGAEEEIRRCISRRWPEHAIIGEEYGQQGDLGGLIWIVDPIDGTRSFVCGVPLYSTLLALVDEQTRRPVVGVIHLPVLGETVYAAAGKGCYSNGRRARVSRHLRRPFHPDRPRGPRARRQGLPGTVSPGGVRVHPLSRRLSDRPHGDGGRARRAW